MVDTQIAAPATLAQRHEQTVATLPFTDTDDLWIGGEWVPSRTTEFGTVTDPATGVSWGRVARATPEEVDRAVAAARRALPDWAGTPVSERARLMLAFADAVEKRSEQIMLTNTLENGSPVAVTSVAAGAAASILRSFSSMAPFLENPDVRPFPDGVHETIVARDPVGVCALIAPWNFPINLVMIKLAPALLAGCTVVIKPASPTPLSLRFLLEAAAEAGIPAGVINAITGNGAVGDMLVRHPDIDKVAFTGSTPVGRSIAAACGELLRPVTLELGGKSSAVVLPDADLDLVGTSLLQNCLRNTGQTCFISTRILVTPERYDEVVELAVATVGAATVGDPLDLSTTFGPSATPQQQQTVRGYISAGIAEGARVVLGGDVPAPIEGGFYVAPTVFADVTADMRIAKEEIFGPVLSIMPCADVNDAVAVANSTDFGLGGIVYGTDRDQALAVAKRIDSGSVGINFFGANHFAPFGGRHDSGLGAEYGIEGLSAYLSPKSIHRVA